MNKNKSSKCRTCLKTNSNLKQLSTKPKTSNITKSYKELIKFIANVEIDADEEGTAGKKSQGGICCSCCKRIRDSYTFIQQIRRCNKLFLKTTAGNRDNRVTQRNNELDDEKIKQEIDEFDEHTWKDLQVKVDVTTNQDSCSTISHNNFDPPDATDTDTQESEHKDESCSLAAIKSELENANVPDVLLPVCILNEPAFAEEKIIVPNEDMSKKVELDEPTGEINTFDPLDDNEVNKSESEGEEEDEEYIPPPHGDIEDDNDDDEHPLDEKLLPVRCDECEKIFPNSILLNRHKKDTHVPDELKIQCPHCPVKFSRRYNMYAHMRAFHKAETVREHQIQPRKLTKTDVCDQCNRAYSDKYKLMAHIKNKHGPDSKPKKEKQPPKRYLCTLCGLICSSQSNLDIHYRRHTGEKPYKCDFCSRAYARLYDVQVHRRVHTGETPFKCTICEKAFKRSNKLKIHMRTHTNERPYKCTQCEKAFKQSKDLNIHKRTHTGERPYKCNVCNSTFTQSNSLKLHQTKTKHLEMVQQQQQQQQQDNQMINVTSNMPPQAQYAPGEKNKNCLLCRRVCKNMDKQNNFVEKCRTCLNKNKILYSLEKMAIEEEPPSLREITYGELLKEVANINIEDIGISEMAQYICACCSRKLKSSHAFIRQAKESNETLLSMLKKEDLAKPALDCLQEAQIDIETCLEIKMESGDDEKDEEQVITQNAKMKIPKNEDLFRTVASEYKENDMAKEAAIVDEIPMPNEDIDFDSDSSKMDVTAPAGVDYSESDCGDEQDPNWQSMNETSSPAKDNLNANKKRPTSTKITESPDEAIAVPCTQCNKIFTNAKVLARHLRNTHVPEEQKCSCPLCGIKFTRSCNMFKHMRTQHDPDTVKNLLPASEKMHQCDKCPQKYAKKKHLNNHILAKHSSSNDKEAGEHSDEGDTAKNKAEDRSLCSICGCSFSKKAYLIVHMRKHTGERPFQCDLCERAFAHNSELKCHRRIHTGEKPYKCKLCEKAFRVYKKLATHMRSHTDERPYKCNQCERSFKYSKDLNIHHRIHTGERPYCCPVCGSTFTQSNSLKAHRMKLGHMDDNNAPKAPKEGGGGASSTSVSNTSAPVSVPQPQAPPPITQLLT
ncbi:uncharacterized protein [Musca autumnalis]|uniref:uncharacterized protein n=1 Tax=Musca autumnalis TaxID=221902 RepID=UPI003CE843AB